MLTETTATAATIMSTFAAETGLTGDRPPRRYLWTDAFAVCNYLALHARTGEARWLGLARDLVAQVHRVLGRHRPDDPRTGWISGLDEAEGARHPTRGGLRIGKLLPERGPDEPYDQRREWDREGQYFHYLTRWMHALLKMAQATGEPDTLRWARELAQASFRGFVYQPQGGGTPRPDHAARMVWKMSVDLSRPLVPSMGHHDPLDGYLTFLSLQEAEGPGPDLQDEIDTLAHICRGRDWATDDPLGLGGLLTDVLRAARLGAAGHSEPAALARSLLDDGRAGLSSYARQQPLDAPAARRLAFRELGLSIGLHAVERLDTFLVETPGELAHPQALRDAAAMLHPYLPLAERVESFWLAPEHQAADTWTEHEDINRVMLATSLAPDGYL